MSRPGSTEAFLFWNPDSINAGVDHPVHRNGGTPPFGYAGQYTDPVTGLIYMRARWYDPTTGQFITKDPIGHASGETNLYHYAGGDPTNHVDPSGLFSWNDAAQLVIGWGDGASYGATYDIREALGINGGVDTCSPYYRVGVGTGIAGTTVATAGLGAEAGAAKAADEAPVVTRIVKTRPNPGRDGGTSKHIVEQSDRETTSVTHQVTRDGEVVHQHQTHVGKYGSHRQFPNDWVEYPTIP